MSNDVSYQREEVTNWMPRWRKIDDVVAGEYAIKQGGDLYLPRPNPLDKSEENQARFDQYLQRAVFFNATSRTLEGLIGIAYRRQPSIEVPESMEFVRSDIDGGSGGIVNQSHRVVEDTFRNARAGLLADFPPTDGEISRAEVQRGEVHATIAAYRANQIINWRTDEEGRTSLVVLHEQLEQEDGFETVMVEQWRELVLGRLSDEEDEAPKRYIVRLWRRGGDDAQGVPEIVEEYEPKDAGGQTWDIIPFSFVGAVDNNAEIDKPPLEDLANLNTAHYRNSADFEESVFFVGQPTIYFAGLDDQWVKTLQDGGVYVGSREAIPLPEGASAGILQAQPNTLAQEGMRIKEQQMVASGARLLTYGEAVKTAEQSRSETAAAHSVLSLVCDNVSQAYTQALGWAQRFTQTNEQDTTFVIPTDFTGLSVDPQLLSALVAGWQSGAIPTSDLYAALRQLGVVDPEKTDQEIEDELELAGGGLNLEV